MWNLLCKEVASERKKRKKPRSLHHLSVHGANKWKTQRCCLPSGAAAKERQLGRQHTRQPLSAAEMNCSHQAFDYPWTYLSFWHPSSSFSLLDGSLHPHRLRETIVKSSDTCQLQLSCMWEESRRNVGAVVLCQRCFCFLMKCVDFGDWV